MTVLACVCVQVSLLAAPARAAPGDLDPRFGEDGIRALDFKHWNRAEALAVRPNGKIIVVSTERVTDTHDYRFRITSLKANGSRDRTFGRRGSRAVNFTPYSDFAMDVAIQGNGKIVVVGAVARIGYPHEVGVTRLHPDGRLDRAFGKDGKKTFRPRYGGHSFAAAVTLDAHRRIVVAGRASDDFVVARLTRRGRLDARFGDGTRGKGIVVTPFPTGGTDAANDVATQGDGRIVVTGYSSSQQESGFGVARYRTDGRLDTSFSEDGLDVMPFGNSSPVTSESVAITGGGKIVLGGVAYSRETGPDFGLVRYEPGGRRDTSFDDDGRVATNFFPTPEADRADSQDEAVAVLLTGETIVTVGKVATAAVNSPWVGLTRHHVDGRLDDRFGDGGKVATSVHGLAGVADAARQKGLGRILALAGDSVHEGLFLLAYRL